jgi:hypothetical protein
MTLEEKNMLLFLLASIGTHVNNIRRDGMENSIVHVGSIDDEARIAYDLVESLAVEKE